MICFIHQILLMNGGASNDESLHDGKLIEYQQNEIELKARQMWKWLNSQHLRQTMNISAPITVQPTALVALALNGGKEFMIKELNVIQPSSVNVDFAQYETKFKALADQKRLKIMHELSQKVAFVSVT